MPPVKRTRTNFSLGPLDIGSLSDNARRTGKITEPPPSPKAKVKGKKLALEEESDEELAELKANFQKAKVQNIKRQDFAEDGAFWVGLIFATNEDANRFVHHVNQPVYGQFMDGYAVAEALNIPIPAVAVTEPHVNIMQFWAEFAMNVTTPPADARDGLPNMPVQP